MNWDDAIQAIFINDVLINLESNVFKVINDNKLIKLKNLCMKKLQVPGCLEFLVNSEVNLSRDNFGSSQFNKINSVHMEPC